MGMFAADGKLYYVTKADGNLNSIALTATGPSGLPTVVDSPAAGGNDWRARALFLVAGNQAPANKPPTAAFSQTCVDLVCHFDGSDSSDTDGTIAGYAWSFEGGGTATGQVTDHEFSDPGTYDATLTVTDDDGDTNTKTVAVTVTEADPSAPISYVGSSTKQANVAAPNVTVPAGVQVGDTLVLTTSLSNATSANAPAGWTAKGDQSSTSSLRSRVWVKTATASDVGGSVTVTMDAVHKASLALTAYRGVDTAQVAASANIDTNTASHTTPVVTVPAGSWVVSAWEEKGANSDWTTPAGVSSRAEGYAGGSGSVSQEVADSNGARTGVVDGTTATANATSARGVNWSIVLPAQTGAPGNAAPTAAFTQTCTDLTCQFTDGSTDSDGTIVGRAWSFGGDGTSTATSPSHTFTGAGTYSVSLTVTDNGGDTNTKTTSVTVTDGGQPSDISYVAGATKSANVAAPSVTVPGTVQAGDTLVLTSSLSLATSANAPAGWTVVGDQTSTSTLRSKVWVKTATAGDANASVAVTMDAVHKATLAITAYRGVNTGAVTATANTDAATATHTTPTITVPSGSWVLSVWADKSANTNWSPAGTVSSREEVYSTGSGAVSLAVADSNAARSGSVAGTTATSSVSSARGVNWSLALPAQ